MPDGSYPALERVIELITGVIAEFESQAFQQDGFSDLTMRQVHYLHTITRLGHPTFSDLARELDISKPSVTAIVAALIRKGYVEKQQDGEDRRAYHIVPTPKASALEELHRALHQRISRRLAANLNSEEVTTLTQLISKAFSHP